MVVWFGLGFCLFCQLDIERKRQFKKMPLLNWPGRNLWCVFFSNGFGKTQATIGSATPGQVVLGCIRNQAEQAKEIRVPL